MGSNSPVTRDVLTVAAESLVSLLNATERPMTPAKFSLHEKKEMGNTTRPGKLLMAPPNLPRQR